jgi:cytochrome c peroxidase
MRSNYLVVLLFFLQILWMGCGESVSKKEDVKKTPKVSTTITALPKIVKSPKDNPLTSEKQDLGRLLFYDPILSGGKDVACATCHHPDNGYAEFLDISIGPNSKGLGSKRKFNTPNDIPFVKRNSQTIINTAFNGINTYSKYDPANAPMFWDNRVKSLEQQALEPIKAFEEMRGHDFSETEILDEVVGRLNKIPEYRELFKNAFGTEEANIENLGKAIAAFERSLVTNNSRFDKYMQGDNDAILISEKEGFELFKKVGCANCHNGPMFSDYKVHVLSTPKNNKLPTPDMGAKDSFGFRTPSLRNLRFTSPYMHNGSLKTLKRVLEFYEDISNGKSRHPLVAKEQFDPLVRELELSVKEMSLIISFLNTLNDDSFDKTIPESVPSGLSVGGNIH